MFKPLIKVQTHDFDLTQEINALRANCPQAGAVAVFVGTVRDLNDGLTVSQMFLEHYPGMTEEALAQIADQAIKRWDIMHALIIHRVGLLQAQEQIVLVAVIGAHRGPAFAACEFMMDYLKTQAPFWKRETTPAGERWVQAKQDDDVAASRWHKHCV